MLHTRRMIEVGDKVRTLSGKFEGRVLGEHGKLGVGGASRFRSLPEDLNLSVVAVIDAEGEIRQFAASSLEKVDS